MDIKHHGIRIIAAALLLAVGGGVSALPVVDDMSSLGWVKDRAGTQNAKLADDGSGVDFPCYFSEVANGDRCQWDKSYSGIDLSNYNALTVRLHVDHPESVRAFGYYLYLPSLNASGATVVAPHSINGGVTTITDTVEQVLPFASLRADCNCTPLKDFTSLSKIRVSPWKLDGTQVDATLTIESIEATNIPVAVIVGDANDYTVAIQDILDRYGIRYYLVDKTKFVSSASSPLNPLRGAKVVIANNATLTATQADALAAYLTAASAKFIGFGPALLGSANLKELLGIALSAGNVTRATGVQFTSSSSGALSLPTAPMAAAYDNVQVTASSSSLAADTIAHWVNAGGTTTVPAWLSNAVGAYRTKPLLRNYHSADEEHILLTLIAHLRPDMATDVVAGVSAHVEQFGSWDTFGAALTAVDSALQARPASPRRTAALQDVEDASDAYTGSASVQTLAKIDKLFTARKELGLAYAEMVRPADDNEMRATWSHSGVGAYPGNWPKSIKAAAEAGFTTMITNVARGASVAYSSGNLCSVAAPLSNTHLCFERSSAWKALASDSDLTDPQLSVERRDPLQASIEAAHAKDMKLVAWKLAFSWGGSSASTVTWLQGSPFVQKEYDASAPTAAISAATPCAAEVRNMDFNALQEIAQNYAVDGIHLDYIRFNSDRGSFDEKCRQAFFTANPSLTTQCDISWPTRVNRLSAQRDAQCTTAYHLFLKGVVTDHVARIRTMIDGINQLAIPGKPPIELSAAVFPVTNDLVSQDWPRWARDGSLDRVFPMTYAATLPDFREQVYGSANQVLDDNGADVRLPMHFGLGGYLASPDGIVAQIEWLRSLTSAYQLGFSFFEFSEDSIDNLLPQIKPAIAFDTDHDGVREDVDNCPHTANADQVDIDGDGVGDACEHGLTGRYFNDSDTTGDGSIGHLDAKLAGAPVLARVDPSVDFYWAGSAAPGVVAADNFSVRWTGRLLVPAYTGIYQFCVLGDDGVRLWVNGVDLFGTDNWKPQDSAKPCKNITLTAGQTVPIQLDFFDLTEEGIVRLYWSWPGQVEQIVPDANLYAR